jgi:hypothetical protein
MELFVTIDVQKILMQAIPAEYRWKCKIFQEWDSIIGSLKGKVYIQNIHQDVIILSVAHPCWAQELLMMSAMFKKKINQIIIAENGKQRIKSIRFSYRSFIKHLSVAKHFVRSSILQEMQLQLATIPFSPLELRALKKVKNDELQEHLSSFYLVCKRKSTFCKI